VRRVNKTENKFRFQDIRPKSPKMCNLFFCK